MKPLKLTLQGFTGIYAAFGRDSLIIDLQTIPQDAILVALVGPNGAGKSTILDSLHPYRVMPSRSSTLGPGGFSFWNQITGTSAMKELLWENDGVRYRTLLSFKTTGKTQKSDSYLYRWEAEIDNWVPVRTADGTLSDGKSSTYDLCIDAILGPPEKFFTAHFSAQGRKTIASYGAGDIKSILASVLNLQGYRELSAKAGLVAKFLRQQLDAFNRELADARKHDAAAAILEEQVKAIEERTRYIEVDEATAHANVNTAREALARLLAKRDALAKNAEEERFLNEQIDAVLKKAAASKALISAQFVREQNRHRAECESAKAAIVTAQSSVQSNDIELCRLRSVLADKDTIAKATARLPSHQLLIKQIDQAIEANQTALAGASVLRAELNKLTAQQARLTSEGQSKSIFIKNLEKTAALIEQVPCKGLDILQSCPLMAQANSARRDMPINEAEQGAKREEYKRIVLRAKELQLKVADIDKIEAEVRDAEKRRRTTFATLDADNRLSARAPLIADAETRIPSLVKLIDDHRQIIIASTAHLTRAKRAVAESESEMAHALTVVETAALAERRVLEERLTSLGRPISDTEVESYRGAVAHAADSLIEVQGRTRALAEQKLTLSGKLQAMRALVARTEQMKEQAARLQEEIAKWKLVEKGLGNDGCVALSIDDSGPEIAAICNTLLKDCFDGRFVVRLDTQSETKSGSVKETFDVKVFDGHRGTEKSLGDMSGGEEVLVNECLTRSVALYAAQSSSTRCETLFTDETDGALDPEAKRAFMQMKRAVIKQGGYGREFFITHTPELWEMADHKILVAEL